ncbi:hypothetical protein J4G63_20415, partial [Aeromonas sobria]
VYSDADNDAEGASTYKWYRNGAEISGATAKTYTVTAADQKNVISFSVTPVAATGAPKVGNELTSVNTNEVVVSGSTGARFVILSKASFTITDTDCLNLNIGGSSSWRMPTRAEMDTLYSAYPSNQISTVLGWDTTFPSWISDMSGVDHLAYLLPVGSAANGGNGSSAFNQVCIMD